jgi:hypothetical protein
MTSKIDAADFTNSLINKLDNTTLNVAGRDYIVLACAASADDYQKIFIEAFPWTDDAEDHYEFSITVRKIRKKPIVNS